jgi:phosphoribosylformimino-5-aminoimidazole carboxamide ribotide isomerase
MARGTAAETHAAASPIARPSVPPSVRHIMILLPAIDLMSGEVVRLRQGKAEAKTVYSSDPAAFARQWEHDGGDYLHIVDLDAAFSGEQRNLEAVRAITEAISIPCELGGGMRSREAIQRALDAGVDRAIIGTRAAESLEFVRDMAREFGGGRIAVGIDAKYGLVAVKGWTEQSSMSALDLGARKMPAPGPLFTPTSPPTACCPGRTLARCRRCSMRCTAS